MEESVFMVIQCNVDLWIHIAMESIMLSNALFSNIENIGKQIEIGILTLYPRMEESFKRRICVSNEFWSWFFLAKKSTFFCPKNEEREISHNKIRPVCQTNPRGKQSLGAGSQLTSSKHCSLWVRILSLKWLSQKHSIILWGSRNDNWFIMNFIRFYNAFLNFTSLRVVLLYHDHQKRPTSS